MDPVSRISILMVEDSALDADLIQARLRAGGIEAEFHRVETRDAFVAAIGARCVDLILADYSLPEFDGLSALGIAREVVARVGEAGAAEPRSRSWSLRPALLRPRSPRRLQRP